MAYRIAYHLVEYSPWPLTGSIGAFFLASGLVSWIHGHSLLILVFSFLILLLTIYQWWRDVVREGAFQGFHTYSVSKGLRLGILLFILSEVCFFAAFFWGYFHTVNVAVNETGVGWPPAGIEVLDAFHVPLLNSIVLLSSGVACTWSHHSLIEGNKGGAIQGLVLTIILGAYFTVLQAGEYYEVSFSIRDGVYGSIFFVATGFHGLHVLIGTTFLFVCLIRIYSCHFSSGHHFGFEAAAWYWHFVDVVWLFLFVSIYWWGRNPLY